MPATISRLPKKGRKHLAADSLYALLRGSFKRVPDPRPAGSSIRLPDALMSGLALFALKDPSLLAFDARRHDENMKRLFHIDRVRVEPASRLGVLRGLGNALGATEESGQLVSK